MYKKISPVAFFIIPVFIFNITVLAGNIKGKVNLEGEQNSNGVLIYIEHVDGVFKPYKKPAVINQKDFKFTPSILPVLAGTTVNFLNSDSVLHNVFTPTKCAGSFNLGTWPRGQIRSYTFENAGCFVTILCDVHPYMQAWIPVLQNPFFAQTNQSGEYEIKNIPPGNYKLKVWYPFYESKIKNIIIKNDHFLEENFALKRSGE